jgi:hypothetical protein
LNSLTACTEQEDLSYKIIQKSIASGRKVAIDSERGTIIVGIKHCIKARLRHFDEVVWETSRHLKIVFNTYDKPTPITSQPYGEETDGNYQKIITLINVLMVVESGTAHEYEPFVVEINSLIKCYNDNLAKHIGRLQANRKNEEKSD